MGRPKKPPALAFLTPPHRLIIKDGVEYITPLMLVTRWGGAIGEPTLRNWRHEGRGPPYTKVGARVVYPLVALIEWEKSNTSDRP
jgi:hypothetical protein